MTLTLKQAAAKLRRNPEVLRRNVDKWEVPYIRYSPRSPYVFTEEALEAYLSRRQASSDIRRVEKCHTNDVEVLRGTSVSRAYDDLLKLNHTQTPKP